MTYVGRIHHSFGARCGGPTHRQGSKYPKLMHPLANPPDLVVRVAKKNCAEEIPRQFALGINKTF